MKLTNIFLFILIGLQSQFATAKVVLPHIFADDMVLQRNSEVSLWGWAHPSEEITVVTQWNNKEYKVKTKNTAKWHLEIITPEAGGPYTIHIKGTSNELVLQNVLIGEVWLCSGQSNMEWSANSGIDNAAQEIKAANFPNIRFFSVDKRTANAIQDDLTGSWEVCTPESMQNFSAIAYFFARRLQGEMNIPIGLIDSSWGGTAAEVWTPADVFEDNGRLLEASKNIRSTDWWPGESTVLYNAMIAPITSFKIGGVLWYQGESNTANAEVYEELFGSMIQAWREQWSYNFPFYFVQIAPFNYEDAPQKGVLVRDAQRRTLKIPQTAMVVVSDICTVDDIHPQNKQDVGLRLANIALKEHYKTGSIEVVHGPLFKELKFVGKKIEVSFDHSQGLHGKTKKIAHFEIAGDDFVFYSAKAIIKDEKVIVSSKNVPQPKYVRYAWGNTILANLFNGAGLPASSFRSQ
ncbi:MAG: sialate O-acetylesterase [Maribacter sp.]|nr:sialate O-acetylesterase [Maribacter sp.]